MSRSYFRNLVIMLLHKRVEISLVREYILSHMLIHYIVIISSEETSWKSAVNTLLRMIFQIVGEFLLDIDYFLFQFILWLLTDF